MGPFLCGAAFTGADVSAVPFVQRLESEFGIPESCPLLRRWWEAVRQRPSVQATLRSSWWWWW